MKSRFTLDIRAVIGVLGALLFALGVVLLLPMMVSLGFGESVWWAFAAVSGLSLLLGAAVWWRFRPEGVLRAREGFAIVASAWLLLSLAGAIPFVLAGVLGSYTDAFFETMSGFTTTGATILGGAGNPAIDTLPRSFLFWRSLTHWLGGMGIIVLTLAILPLLGVGGMQLFRAEVPGPTADKLTPLVKQTAQRLWLIYLGFTVLEALLLLPGMSLFDAVNHAFATMATGGFSTRNGSVGEYGSAYVDWIVTVFMLLAGINFALHYRMLLGRVQLTLKDTEFKVYAAIVAVATTIVTAAVWRPFSGAASEALQYEGFFEALRYGAFQVAAIVTTTGFGTADYEVWPAAAMTLVFILFFVGGMAGSTGGGVKIIRHVVLFKASIRELRRLMHPQALIPIRINDKSIPNTSVLNIVAFMVVYAATLVFGSIMLSLMGIDVMSALSATMSAVGNIGPAFGAFGPTENYAAVPVAGKWLLAILMMMGRLELFTVFVLFHPDFWRR